jgi:hypothetical protein
MKFASVRASGIPCALARSMKAAPLAISLALSAASCAPPDEAAAPGTMSVTITAVDTHVTRRGEVTSLTDRGDREVAIHIPNGAAGFEVRPTDWNTEVTIDGVPEGTYYFQLGDRYFVTSSPMLDLGATILGRPDAIDSKVRPTDLVFDLDGLSPWQELYDEIQVLVPDVGEAYIGANFDLRSPPISGTTRLSDARLDWSGHSLIKGSSAGDRLAVAQIVRTIPASGWGYRRLERFNEVESFEQQDGNETRLAGSLIEVPLDSSIQLDWRKTQFAAFGADVHPRAEPLDDYLGVAVLPRAAEHGFYSDAPDLFYMFHVSGAEDLIDTYSFGNPYPESWDKFVLVYSTFAVEYALGSAEPAQLEGILASELLLTDVVGRPVRPALSPVTNIRVEGRMANVDLTGVGATPAIAWDEPRLGIANGYVVTAFRLADLEGETQLRAAASFYTDSTAFRVVPGALDPYGVYVFAIRAIQRPGGSLAEAPFRKTFPESYADAFTEKVAP